MNANTTNTRLTVQTLHCDCMQGKNRSRSLVSGGEQNAKYKFGESNISIDYLTKSSLYCLEFWHGVRHRHIQPKYSSSQWFQQRQQPLYLAISLPIDYLADRSWIRTVATEVLSEKAAPKSCIFTNMLQPVEEKQKKQKKICVYWTT